MHLRPVLRVAEDLVGRDASRLDDLLLVIDVVDVEVERPHPLTQAGLELPPLRGRDDARDDVERNQALGAAALFVLFAVDSERDADATEDQVGFRALVAHRVLALLFQPALEFAVVLAHAAIGAVHLVVRLAHPAACDFLVVVPAPSDEEPIQSSKMYTSPDFYGIPDSGSRGASSDPSSSRVSVGGRSCPAKGRLCQ